MLIWNYWPGPEGGSERQCRLIAHHLQARDIQCEVLTSRSSFSLPRSSSDDGIVVRRFGCLCPLAFRIARLFAALSSSVRRITRSSAPETLLQYDRIEWTAQFWLLLPFVWLARLSFLLAIFRHFKRMTPSCDVIHLHEPAWLGGVAVDLGIQKGIPVLCQEATFPTLPIPGYDTPFRRHWQNLRMQAWYAAIAPYIAKDLEVKGIPSSRILTVPNGVNIPFTVADCGSNHDVLFVGNFSQRAHWKGFDVLIKAWAEVHKTIPVARLILVGGGDSSIWQDYAERAGCGDSLNFAGRADDPDAFYAKAGVFVLPSRVEGISNALLEAQSWGLPCVVSDIPGNLAVVEDGVNGLVARVGDAEALAKAIVRLLESSELRTQLGKAAREKMKREFSMELVTEKLIRIYHGIASERSR